MANNFSLTSAGETRALRVKQVKNPEDAVVSFVYENTNDNTSSVSFDEILDETEMDNETAKKVLDRLIRKGLITEA